MSTIADKKGFKVLLPAVYTLGSFSLMLMGIKASMILLYAFVILVGFFLFSAHSLVNAFVSQHYPEEIRTTAIGFPNSIGRFGSILGPTVGGLLLSGNASVTEWFITFGSAGLIAAISFIIINLATKEDRVKKDNATL
ncbi:MFS transporter [Paenibacillus sp. 8b26]|uniref:MFS transporter n=1 Tax=Paenibacillus sp. 8b26 TaxID=3424133 RepID=UPI003D660A9D